MIVGLLLTGVALVATLFVTLAPRFWVADLGVHFRLQYAALAFAGFVILAACDAPGWAALALLVAAINALIAAPLLFSRDSGQSTGARERMPLIRLAAINVYYRNRKFQPVVDFVGRERPDAVVLVEVTAEWEQALGRLSADYPHRFITRGSKGVGVLLLSRWPLLEAAVVPGFSDAEPAVAATLQIHGRTLQLLGVHTSWPLGRGSAALRDRQLARLGEVSRSMPGPLVVLGDLNVSPFSRHFHALLAVGNLKSAAQGRGWQATWPTFMPVGGIQIDHALSGAGVDVVSFRRGVSVGSDHLPIIVEFVL